MELIVGIIAAAFVALAVFAIITLQNLSKTLKKADRTLTEVHKILDGPAMELVQNSNKLIADLKKKSEALDLLFRPLYVFKKERPEPNNRYEKVSEVVEFVAEGVRIFKMIKDEIK